MEKLHILTADILDILFDGRNKSYGAYELRKTYDRRLAYAFSGTVFICLFFIAGAIMANGKRSVKQADIFTTMQLENFKKEEKKPEIPKPIVQQEPPKLEMAKVTPPLIMPDELVPETDEVKPVDEIENTRIGPIDQKGLKEDFVNPPVETTQTGIQSGHVESEIDGRFTPVQIEARFPGGREAWIKFLERNLNKDIPTDNGAPAGDYTVTVSFIVDKNGAISDVRAENDPGYGTQAEAIRVIRKGPNWVPAVQNGQNVLYRQKQNITFRISDQ